MLKSLGSGCMNLCAGPERDRNHDKNQAHEYFRQRVDRQAKSMGSTIGFVDDGRQRGGFDGDGGAADLRVGGGVEDQAAALV